MKKVLAILLTISVLALSACAAKQVNPDTYNQSESFRRRFLFYSDSACLITIRNRRTEPVKPFLGRSCRTGTPPVPILGLRSVVRSLPEGALISARR